MYFITAPHSFYCVTIEASLFSLFMDQNDSAFVNWQRFHIKPDSSLDRNDLDRNGYDRTELS